MKRTLLTAAAALTLIGAFAPVSAFADPQDHRGQDSRQAQQPAAQTDHDRQNDGRDHRDGRHAWRDSRTDAKWDETQHNGYYTNNRWHYGAPPAGAAASFGYHPWARGQRLGYYQSRYAEVNYRDNHLRRPPHGYHWVRDDRGDYLLAAVASGLIAQVIFSSTR